MTTLLKNGKVVNVFINQLESKNVLIQDHRIIGVGDYDSADTIVDVSGKYICPSFIDTHIHIESSLLTPKEFAKVCIPHGTGAVIADPHEIANVCGIAGINAFLFLSRGLPMDFYFTLPSCVPATPLDENGATLTAKDYIDLIKNNRIMGLGEVMNYPGVINGDPLYHTLIALANSEGKVVCGHAPLLSGEGLDAYIAAGIEDDHECSLLEEALEKFEKGQHIMIREGSSARNLQALIDLFDEPYCYRSLLATDDKFDMDLIKNGHIDHIIREAAAMGKSAIIGIRMATIQAAEYFGLKHYGAVAPGYFANLLVLNDLDTVDVRDVYHKGKLVCKNKVIDQRFFPKRTFELPDVLKGSFAIKTLTEEDFHIEPKGSRCRVIQLVPGDLITKNVVRDIDFDQNNGVDLERDIIKVAVCERHKNTGHIGLGFAEGFGFKQGALAASVSHDSHNLIIAGTNEKDMALVGNKVAEMGGGFCVACDGEILSAFPLPIAGLMSDKDAATVSESNKAIHEAIEKLNVNPGIEPIMNLAFISLPVIPELKMSTQGLVDVNAFQFVSLFVDDE